MMNPEVKAKWLDALRGGTYQQGVGKLRDYDEYCCLGVLCDIAVEEGAVPGARWTSEGEMAFIDAHGEADFSDDLPPRPVVDWAGLGDGNPSVWVDDLSQTLAELNDTGSSFEEIADLIEEQL